MERIAFISEHASPLALLGGIDNGGQNVYVAALSSELAQRGYQVDIYTRRDNFAVDEIVCWRPGIRIIHVQAGPVRTIAKEQLLGHMEQFTQNMLAIIARDQLHYRLIHAHFFMSALVAAKIKKVLGTPYLVTFHALGLVRKLHQQEQDGFPPERIQIERYIVEDADRLIAECPQDRDDLIQHYGADPARISIAPCGFDPAEFYPIRQEEARHMLGLPKDEKILLQLGRMVPRKGIDNVIAAMAGLKMFRGRIRLLVVGGESDQPDPARSPELRRLMDIAARLEVAANVTFTGRRDRQVLKYYYAAADVFISTPWYEPFGITPLEAMACGTPVIGSQVGGIKYSVVHRQTGLLVPPHDPAALADAIVPLLTDTLLYRNMQRNAIRRVNSQFTWSKVADTIENIYRKTALQPARPLPAPATSFLRGKLALKPLEKFWYEHLLTRMRVQP